MSQFESIDLCRGDHGELTAETMARADRVRHGLVYITRNISPSGIAGEYVEPTYGDTERTDESLLALEVSWQSDDIWE